MIQDGTFELLNDTLRYIAGPNLSVAQLRELARILGESQRLRRSPQEIADEIEEQGPQMGPIAQWMREYLFPKDAATVWTIIGVLVTVIPMILSSLQPKEELTQKDLATIVANAVASAMAQQQQKASAASRTSSDFRPGSRISNSTAHSQPGKKKAKIGRNDPCQCGSGRKYKHCCIDRANVGRRPLP